MEAGHPAVGADPEGAIGARTEGPNVIARQVAVGGGEDLPSAFLEAGQPAAGADPEGAVDARTEGPNVVVRQITVGRGEDLPGALMEAGQPAAEFTSIGEERY